MGETAGWNAAKATLFICKTCRGADGESRPGAAMVARLRTTFEGSSADAALAIRPVTCLSQCSKAVAAALTRPDGFSYIFSGLNDEDLPDLATGAALLAEDERGLLPLRGRPPALKRTLVARIPPFTHQEEMP